MSMSSPPETEPYNDTKPPGRDAIMRINKLMRISVHPVWADNALSKINTDDEISLYAAMASFILTFRLIWWYLLDLTKSVRRLCWLSWV